MRRGETKGKQRQCVSVSACGNAVLPFETMDNVAGERESGSSYRSRGSFNPLAQILNALICSRERGRGGLISTEMTLKITSWLDGSRLRDECVSGERIFGLCFSTAENVMREADKIKRDLLTMFFFPAVKGWEKCMQCFMDFPMCSILCIFFSNGQWPSPRVLWCRCENDKTIWHSR